MAPHTHIHNLNYCPRANAFLDVKKRCLHINRKIVQTAWTGNTPACFGQVQRKIWTIRLFLFSCSGGGLSWYAVVCLHLSGFTAYRPKFLWWFVVVCGGQCKHRNTPKYTWNTEIHRNTLLDMYIPTEIHSQLKSYSVSGCYVSLWVVLTSIGGTRAESVSRFLLQWRRIAAAILATVCRLFTRWRHPNHCSKNRVKDSALVPPILVKTTHKET